MARVARNCQKNSEKLPKKKQQTAKISGKLLSPPKEPSNTTDGFKANSLQVEKFTTAIQQNTTESAQRCLVFFSQEKRQENGTDSTNYGGSEILRLQVLYLCSYRRQGPLGRL